MFGSRNLRSSGSLPNDKNNSNKVAHQNENKTAGRYGIGGDNKTALATTTAKNTTNNSGGIRMANANTTQPFTGGGVNAVAAGFMEAAAGHNHHQQPATINRGCGGATTTPATTTTTAVNKQPTTKTAKAVNSPFVGQTHSVEGGSRAQTVENNNSSSVIQRVHKQQQQTTTTSEFATTKNQVKEQFCQINLKRNTQQNGVATVGAAATKNPTSNLLHKNCATSAINSIATPTVAGQQLQQQNQRNFYNTPTPPPPPPGAIFSKSDFVPQSDLKNINNNQKTANTASAATTTAVKTTTLNLPVTSYAATQQQQQPQHPVEQTYYTNNSTSNNNTNTETYTYTYNPQDYDENFDEDMEAERDLAEDAQWKKIQQNTFTRWANEHLKTIDRSIANLESDLSDGLRLIALIEVLSQKRMPKYNKRPTFRSQKLENVSVALKFLEDEGIKIVNIDSSDIVDCKLKLILGLIWTLILHYSISMPMWEGEDEQQLNGSGPTPKQRLLNWIHGRIPDLPIKNFTNDWTTGKAVGALVDACAPGLCPDWEMWDPKDAVQNASEAMGLADDWLNVRQLIKPEELVNPNVDEQSMMTYLSQYPNAKLKQGAPLRPKTNPNSIPPPRVRAYGPGIEPIGPVVGAPANFTVETFSAGKGSVDVEVISPDGLVEPADVRFNNDKNLTYSISYVPKMEGEHKVMVKFSGRDIPKSPFPVKVEGHAGDASKVKVTGPGVQPSGVVISKPTFFDILTHDAGRGVPEVIIIDPANHKTSVAAKVRQLENDVWRCEYVSAMQGLHSVNVFYAGTPIPNSPFPVKIAPLSDAKRVRASGRGLQAAGVRVGDDADFKIYTEGAGEGVPEVRIVGPGGMNENVAMTKLDAHTYECHYFPNKEGRYVAVVTFAGQEINKSPFEVKVGPKKESNIVAFGPGLVGGVVGYPAAFVVETNGETGALGFTVAGPSQAEIECHDNGDGSALVKYHPTAPGEYAVHILCDNEDIPKSPFITQILPKTDYHPENVKAYGPGLEKNGVAINEPTSFTVDATKGGPAPLDVIVEDIYGKRLPVNVKNQPDGTKLCTYTPLSGTPHTVEVNFGGVAAADSPHRVYVGLPVDAAKVQAFGPWFQPGVHPNSVTHFNVDCRDAGEAELKVKIVHEETKVEIPCRIIDNEDQTYSVEVAPPTKGAYTTTMTYGGQPVPLGQKVLVEQQIDVSRIKVDGLEPTAPLNSLQQFRIITHGLPKADLAVTITSPSGSRVKAHVIPTAEGFLVNFTPTQLGEYLLSICFGGTPITPRPFRLQCLSGSDSNKVRAFGPGLEKGLVGQPAEFMIDTRGAGQGGLGVTVEGPCEAAINCRDNGDGTCNVAYLPTEAGDYTVNITFNERHINGSPFQPIIFPLPNLSNTRVSGIGIQPHGVIMNEKTDFMVDMSKVGANIESKKLSCSVFDPKGQMLPSEILPGPTNDVFRIMYTPFEAGRHTIELLYDNIPVPGSPFVVNVKSGCDPTRCKAYGPGLKRGFVNEKNKFVIETKGAGKGGLSLAIEGPSEAKLTCIDNRDGSCDVDYLATEVGEYDISIRFADKHIPGSPFTVYVEERSDPSKVKVYGPGIEHGEVREAVPTHFFIDVQDAGPGRIAVKIQNSEGKPIEDLRVEEKGDGIYCVHYSPPKEGSVLTCTITFADTEVPCSPFVMTVFPKSEPKKVKIKGVNEKRKTPASRPAEFEVDTKKAGQADINVDIKNPKGKHIKPRLQEINDGTYVVSFVPDECGTYHVSIKYGGQEIEGSPFKLEAFQTGEAKKCKLVEEAPKTQPSGSKSHLTVDARDAGDGAVTCKIASKTGKEIVDIDVIEKDGFFDIFYALNDPGDYDINVKFGGKDIPNGSFSIKAVEQYSEYIEEHTQVIKTTTQVRRQTTQQQQQQLVNGGSDSNYRTVAFEKFPVPTTGGIVVAEVKMPSGKVDKPIIQDNRDGTVSVKYDPKEEGSHELIVKYNGEPVQGSPFKFHVDSITSGYVTAYGPGLTHGVTGEPCNFTISTKGASAAGLTMAVEGPSKVDINYHDNKDGTVSVQYLPTAPGEYHVAVRFGDKHIKGSPYVAKITGEGRKRNQISVGSCSEVTMPGEITDDDLRALNASIQAPSGLEEPCFLKRMPTGNIGISFTPRETGEHLVSVKRMGKHIPNSPFKVTVMEREVGDAKKVKVSGSGLKEGKTHTENIFSVDTRNAGYGGLSVSIEGPSKAEIQCTDKDDGTLNISYKPTEPGYYIVNLKFADHHVEGSPFTVKVAGEGSNRKREKIQRERDAVPVTEIGSKCKLTFKMPGITSFDLAARVTSPSNVTEDAEIQEVEDGLYSVHFVPKELGVHTVSVRYKDMHIPGSPFQFTVGPLHDFGSHLVKAGGNGLERGRVGVANEFNVWTREAGGGSLAISVEGPSKAEIEFKDRKDGSCDVAYKVTEPGEYRVGLKFNDRHIPDSPFKVYVSPDAGDAHKLEVQQFPEGSIQADAPYQFLVRKNGAKGELDAKIVAPSGTDDDCFIQAIDSDMTSVRFYPRENGIHAIHVKFNGVHIPGSPFRIKVGKDVADPAAVHASGSGLELVKTGHKADFIINTCNAGVGTLSVAIDGPSKVAMDCTEVEEGYKVRYTPLLPGDHYVSVKYNNIHIIGSPFKVSCEGDKMVDEGAQETSTVVVETVHKVAKSGKNTGVVMPAFKSDASQVTSKGMGLKKAFMGKTNTFTICATEAGNNILYVGMYGPKGPCEEFSIKHTGRNNYNVSYMVRDRGQYILIVKWGDEHIPGSPFQIDV
ncbi:filamin-A isoform X3 [Stomoxys calcitrans]|uniref:filamin-A isoform X3 n=1 Tax=Stomoxys calcitrans TaxID=35570 RepID=UPI0027E30CDB|nr:filamin-A isoform X3 [Stomoxys calcitrans]